MSNYRAPAFNPTTKRVENADFVDNYFGKHEYGIKFDDDQVFRPHECDIWEVGKELERCRAEVEQLRALQKCECAPDEACKALAQAWGERDSANAEAARLANRLENLAAGFDVPDAGKYTADWQDAIKRYQDVRAELPVVRAQVERYRTALEAVAKDWATQPGTVLEVASEIKSELTRRMQIAADALSHLHEDR